MARFTGLLVLFLAPALPLAAADPPAPSVALTYVCAGGAVLQAAYINPDDGTSFAVVGWAGRLVPMRAGPTGSGVRYEALDGSGLVWHGKGNGGLLLGPDGAILLDACTATGP